MSRWKITYHKHRKLSPLSYWVHQGTDKNDRAYRECTTFEPPFPNKIVGKGHPYLKVAILGAELEFASMTELEHCITILSRKVLPTTISLSKARGTGYGPNNHWLSRFPAHLKSWAKRERLVATLKKVKYEISKDGIGF